MSRKGTLCEAARLYNVPVETLRRRTNGLECKPGPSTVLTSEEEKCLTDYVQIKGIMRIAFTIVEKSGRPHPFNDGMAGWKLSGSDTHNCLPKLCRILGPVRKR